MPDMLTLRALKDRQNLCAICNVYFFPHPYFFPQPYTDAGGGSRGARAYCAPDGDCLPTALAVGCRPWCFRSERKQLRAVKQVLRWQDCGFHVEHRELQTREELTTIFFEKDWAHFLADSITDDDFRHQATH